MEELIILGYEVPKTLYRRRDEDWYSYNIRQQEYAEKVESAKKKHDKLLEMNDDMDFKLSLFTSEQDSLSRINVLESALDVLLNGAEADAEI